MNPSAVTKDQLEGVSYPIADLDRRHPCLEIGRRGVVVSLDAREVERGGVVYSCRRTSRKRCCVGRSGRGRRLLENKP